MADVSQLYNLDAVNYTSTVSDYEELLCTEVISEWIREKGILDQIGEGIPNDLRKGDYIVDNHDGDTIDSKNKCSNRIEEITAKEMYGKSYDNIGEIVAYQVPLDDEQKRGKIDLLSVNNDTLKIHILELKRYNDEETGKTSKETMLRCLLESFTYYKIIDLDKLKTELKAKGKLSKEPGLYEFVVSPLVFKDTQPFNEMIEIKNGKRKKLNDLIDYMNTIVTVIPYYLDRNGEDVAKANCYGF